MRLGRVADYRFHCDECDGDIAEDEEYIEFQGMNYCEDCFDNHRFDLDIEEEGTELTCDCCGNAISKIYYRFDGEFYCNECVEDNKTTTTKAERDYDERLDMRYEGRF